MISCFGIVDCSFGRSISQSLTHFIYPSIYLIICQSELCAEHRREGECLSSRARGLGWIVGVNVHVVALQVDVLPFFSFWIGY